MTRRRIGSLFAGYGGLDLAVSSVLDAEPAWFSEHDEGPAKILSHRFPGIPNHGDITMIDWQAVEPVDILTGGSPCQDLSHAGRRAGMTEGTRSNLWVAMREAIAQLQPSLVVWENVGGAFSAAASSEVEPCPGCVGDGSGVHLRALGRVLGDLATLGYDARWVALRAADVGAPHGRLRVFLAAHPAGDPWGQLHGDGGAAPEAAPLLPEPAPLLPSPRTSDTNGAGRHGDGGLDLRTAITMLPTTTSLLPTPAVNDMGASYTPEEWDAWTDRMKAEHGNGNGHGKSLHIEKGGPNQAGSSGDLMLPSAVQPSRWGQYAAAIQRWETLTRPAPPPTVRDWDKWRKRKHARVRSRKPVGMRGSIRFMIDGPPPQLSPAFSEWMMGLPAGWVTDVPGITRNEALKALGNGVVPQQCAAALNHLLVQADLEPVGAPA